jgi:hypothetical protein
MYKLVILFILSATVCFGQVAEPARPMIQLPDGSIVGAGNPLPVDAQVNIGSVTVEAFPVFSDQAGDPATSQLDSSGRVKINIGSETIGLITAINAITSALNTQTNTIINNLAVAIKAIQDIPLVPAQTTVTRISLPANTSTLIEDIYASNPLLRQKYVEIKTVDPSQEFWLAFGTAAVIGGNARPCMGTVYVESRTQNMYVIASEAVDIFVTRAAIAIQP